MNENNKILNCVLKTNIIKYKKKTQIIKRLEYKKYMNKIISIFEMDFHC